MQKLYLYFFIISNIQVISRKPPTGISGICGKNTKIGN